MKEAIDKVREVEDKCKTEIKNSQLKGKEIINNYKLKGESHYKDVVGKMLKERDDILKKTGEEVTIELEPEIKNAEVKSQEILNISKEKILKMSKLILNELIKQ